MALQVWMKREQWLIWIAAAIVLTLVLAAIGHLALEQAASLSGPVAMAAHDRVGPVPRQRAWRTLSIPYDSHVTPQQPPAHAPTGRRISRLPDYFLHVAVPTHSHVGAVAEPV